MPIKMALINLMSSVDLLKELCSNKSYSCSSLIGAREGKHPILTVPVGGVKSLDSKNGPKNLLTTVNCLTAQIR